jgi:site-specific recombinase XerD
MKKNNLISKHIENFFTDHLITHRGVSQNTIKAYRDVLKLFLLFIAEKNNKNIVKVNINDFTIEIVLDFLKSIEKKRQNSTSTRNHRLAVLRTFFTYLGTQEPKYLLICQKVALIPFKRSARPMMHYLEVDEMDAILKSVDIDKRNGLRDFTLLSLLYNTGARVQEICDLKVSNLRLESPPLLTITGKGNKTRQVPIWESTQKILIDYLRLSKLDSSKDFLFTNRGGDKLSRYGIRYILAKYVQKAEVINPKIKDKNIGPHTIRHTTAMHLLQSGVDLNVIKSWLGHVDVSTTHGYVEIDLEMKRKALEKCSPVQDSGLSKFLKKNEDVISWLESL